MSAALDTEQCAGCAAVKICTRWNPNGSWDYTKGIEPCRPVPEEDFTRRVKKTGHFIDADEENKNRFRLRSLK